MSADPSILSIWTHRRSSPPSLPHLAALTAPSPDNDPTKLWISYLMRFGGFFILLGIPALVAIPLFIRRMVWLKRHCKPHNYGRTGLIYWPSQIFISLACLILVAASVSLVSSGLFTDGLLPGVLLTLMAWVCQIGTFVYASLLLRGWANARANSKC